MIWWQYSISSTKFKCKFDERNPPSILTSNSSVHQFDSISELIKGKVDIFLINETKLDGSNHFTISGYKVIRIQGKKIWPGISFDSNDQNSFRYWDSSDSTINNTKK